MHRKCNNVTEMKYIHVSWVLFFYYYVLNDVQYYKVYLMYNEYIKMNEKSDDVGMEVRAKNDVVQNFI